jgi:hypothetical protein
LAAALEVALLLPLALLVALSAGDGGARVAGASSEAADDLRRFFVFLLFDEELCMVLQKIDQNKSKFFSGFELEGG